MIQLQNKQINQEPSSFAQSSTSVKLTKKAQTCFSRLVFKSIKQANTTSTSIKRNRYKKIVCCILALTISIISTQVVYLSSWPFYDPSKKDQKSFVNLFYFIGVWLSYLTSLFNPILLCFFNEKVKKHLKKLFC